MIRFKNITKTALSLVLVASMTLPVMQTAIVSQAADLTTEEISAPEIVGGSDNLGNAIGVSEEYRTYNGYSYNKLTDSFEAPITYNGKTYVESVPRATVEKSNWFVEMYGEEFRGVSVSEFTRKANGIAIVGSFTPSRTYYAQFLASYSGTQNDIVKGVWEKLFYEELNWDSSKSYYTAGYSKWSDKYYSTYSSITNDDYRSSKGQTITYSTGDWEIYFASALVNNPEFLGDMLGMDDYTVNGKAIKSPGQDAAGNELMRKVMYTYLSQPAKYSDLAIQVANLTADGTYIGTSKTDSNNILHKCGKSYNGIDYDILMLITLASLYTGADKEPHLTTLQVDWIKSYLHDLYTAYTTGNNATLKSIVANNATIYDAVARSTYASNNENGWGQRFFDYVEGTGKGAGAWLNQNDNINISNLGNFGSIRSIYKASEGYCAGHRIGKSPQECSVEANCKLVPNGGKALPADEAAYYIYNNATARAYITGTTNSELKSLYTNPNDPDGGWLEKYGWKHAGKPLPPGPYTISGVNIVTGGGSSHSVNDGEYCWEGHSVFTTSTGTATVHLDRINSATGQNILSKVQAITVDYSYSGFSGWGPGATFDGWDVSGPGKGLVSYNNKTFDISNIDGSANRANTKLYFTISGNCSYYANPLGWGDGHNHCDTAACTASTSVSPTVVLSVMRSDCAVYGHDYKGRAEFDLNDMTAKITYICKNDSDHTWTTEPLPLTISKKANGDVQYTVTSPYSYKKNDAGQYTSELDSYSTYVFASGSSTKNVSMTSSYTALSQGYYEGSSISNNASSNELINPAGARSQTIYKSATSTITFKTKKNVILPGCKKLVVNVGTQGDLINLSIVVRDRFNNVLAVNSQPKQRNVVSLVGLSDDNLNGATVEVTATSNTTNSVHSSQIIAGYSSLVPAAHTKVTAYSIDFYYQ